MFETESQDYAMREVAPRQELYIKGRADIDADYEKVKKIWQDGAEFGYNKAMEEWKKHFMQCSSPFCLDKFSNVRCYGELGNMAKKEGEEKC